MNERRSAAVESTSYRLILRAVPGEVDATARLRQALKVLLRRFGFRCVRVEQVSDDKRKVD